MESVNKHFINTLARFSSGEHDVDNHRLRNITMVIIAIGFICVFSIYVVNYNIDHKSDMSKVMIEEYYMTHNGPEVLDKQRR